MKLLTRNHFLLVMVASSILGCGVVTNQYSEGNFISRSSFSVKPAYRDSTVSATYISGAVNGTNGKNGFNTRESSAFGLISAHKAITKKNMNLAYGGYLHGGSYNAKDRLELAGGNKSFFGGGISTEINYNIPSKLLDWRVIGAKLSYQYESGEFASFRENAYAIGLIGNERHKYGSLRLNVTTELIVKLQNHEFGYGVSLSSGEYLYVGSKVFLTAKKLTYSITRNQSIPHDRGRAASMIGFGLEYRLK